MVVVLLVILGGCLGPAEVRLPDATSAPVIATVPASPASSVVLVGEASGEGGCFGGDLVAYGVPGGALRRLAVPAVSGGAPSPVDGAVFYPKTIVEGQKWRTIIEKIDMRTAATTLRIDAGAGVFGNGLYSEPRCHTVLGVTPDGSTLTLARAGVEGDSGRVRLDVFDARSGESIAAAWFSARAGASADVTVHALVRDRISLTLHSYTGCTGGSCSSAVGLDHYILDGRLQVVGRTELACGRRQLAGPDTIVAMCGSDLRMFDRSGQPRGSVAVPVGSGERLLGWRSVGDRVVILSERQVVRVDLAAQRVIDARQLFHPRSLRLPSPFGPALALAKTAPSRPGTQISPDGRTAYVVAWPPSGSWRPGISVIDIDTAKVRQALLAEREILGIQLSGDGSRLFALTGDGGGTGGSEIVAIEAGSAAVLSTVRLERSALALISAAP